MSKWLEAGELLKKIISAKEVIPIQSDLINLQQTMFSLQNDQIELNAENTKLKTRIEKLLKKKDYIYAPGHTWYIHPDRPDIKLCPICLNRDDFENPTITNGGSQYCATCKKEFR